MNEVGRLATGVTLKQFDTDGEPMIIGDIKLTSRCQSGKNYQTPYGATHIDRHVYQGSKGGKIYVPLDTSARIIQGATPRFAKILSHKYSNLTAPSVIDDLSENHDRKIAQSYRQNVTDYVGSAVQAKEESWNVRRLDLKHYVYLWADGIYFNVRKDDNKTCILVIIGVTERGQKELIAIEDGYRESEQSWLEVLHDIKSRGLAVSPKLAVGDGALGFWNALDKVHPQTRHQRCWVHKTANILTKMPKSVPPKAKEAIHNIWMAETREMAEKAFDAFVSRFEAKYPKAVECLVRDKEKLLIFYDFPAEHWAPIRTTNPIESTFATVRHRTNKTKNCVSRISILTLAFKLVKCAEKRWNKLRGFKLLADVIDGVPFKEGIKEIEESIQGAA